MFIKNNQPFFCGNCKQKVEKHPRSSRDHCNHCLYGRHVDINPGDRKNNCKGLLEPIGLKISGKKDQIVYRCGRCKSLVQNIIAPDDDVDKLTQLVSNPVYE